MLYAILASKDKLSINLYNREMKTEKLLIPITKCSMFLIYHVLVFLIITSGTESGTVPQVTLGNTTSETQNKTESGSVIPVINNKPSILKADESTGRGIFSFLRPFGITKYFQIGSGYNEPHGDQHHSDGSNTPTKNRDDIIYDDDPPHEEAHHGHHHGPPASGGIVHWPFGIRWKQYHGPGHLASGPYGPPGAPPLAHQGLNPFHNKPEDAGNGLEYEKVKLKYEVYRLKAKNRLARLQLRLERRKIMSLILQYMISMLKWWL